MEEQNQGTQQEKEPELRQPEEAVKDLEPDARESGDVKGGAVDAFLKVDIPQGES